MVQEHFGGHLGTWTLTTTRVYRGPVFAFLPLSRAQSIILTASRRAADADSATVVLPHRTGEEKFPT